MGEIAVESLEPGKPTLRLSGDFVLADAVGIRRSMLEALDGSARELVLDADAVTGAELTFFQLLFSLALQARQEGKRIVLGSPLPAPLRRAAGDLGIAQRDFDQAFSFEDHT